MPTRNSAPSKTYCREIVLVDNAGPGDYILFQMAACKIILTKTVTGIFVSAVFLLVIQPAYSQELQWTSLTSFKEVRRMNLIDDKVYMSTSGGLMILEAADVSSAGLRFTNVDGLGTTDITEVIKDASGAKWISGFGRLIRYENGLFEPRLFIDQNNNLLRLHCLADDGNSIWVGSEIGLVLYSKIIDSGPLTVCIFACLVKIEPGSYYALSIDCQICNIIARSSRKRVNLVSSARVLINIDITNIEPAK